MSNRNRENMAGLCLNRNKPSKFAQIIDRFTTHIKHEQVNNLIENNSLKSMMFIDVLIEQTAI